MRQFASSKFDIAATLVIAVLHTSVRLSSLRMVVVTAYISWLRWRVLG